MARLGNYTALILRVSCRQRAAFVYRRFDLFLWCGVLPSALMCRDTVESISMFLQDLHSLSAT